MRSQISLDKDLCVKDGEPWSRECIKRLLRIRTTDITNEVNFTSLVFLDLFLARYLHLEKYLQWSVIMPNDPDYKKEEEQSVFRFNLSSFKVRLPCLQLSIVQSRGLREKGRCSELISRWSTLQTWLECLLVVWGSWVSGIKSSSNHLWLLIRMNLDNKDAGFHPVELG